MGWSHMEVKWSNEKGLKMETPREKTTRLAKTKSEWIKQKRI